MSRPARTLVKAIREFRLIRRSSGGRVGPPGRRTVWATAIALAIGFVATASVTPAQAAHTLPHRLSQYPLVGVHNPRWGFLLDTYGEAKMARVLARYDAIVAHGAVFRAQNIPILNNALALNPRLVFVLQWGIIETGLCDSVTSQRAKLREHLVSLADFRSKLSGIQIDGAGNLSQCPNGVSKVKDALKTYRNLITTLGMRAVLTVNGAHFPSNVSTPCRYDASKDGFGAYGFAGLEKLVSGVLKEAWTDRRSWTAPLRSPPPGGHIGGLLDEVCAWHTKAVQPSVMYGFGQSCTPWWYLQSKTGCNWKKARVAFATAQMYNRTIHMHTAAAQDPNNLASQAHVFWLDYYAVDVAGGVPPSHGSNKKEPGDDNHAGQLKGGGYLGPPVSAAKRISGLSGGAAMVREFRCGFVAANWSSQSWVYQPPVATQMVLGRQDRAYDRGESWKKYTIPSMDGRVLMKKSCLTAGRQATKAGTWRP